MNKGMERGMGEWLQYHAKQEASLVKEAIFDTN
jgi:hypothetical protein